MSAPRLLAIALATWSLLVASAASAQEPLVDGTSSSERNRKGVVRADDDFAPDGEQRTGAVEPPVEAAPAGGVPSLQTTQAASRYVVNQKVPRTHRVHTLTMGLNYEDACATNNSAPWRYGISDAEKIHATLKETATPGGGHELLVGKDVDRLRITSALDAFPMSDGPDDLIVYMAAAPGVRGREYMIKLCGAEIPVADFFASIESRGFDRVVVFFAGPHAYKILRGYMDYTDERPAPAAPVAPATRKKKALSRGVDFHHEGFSASAAPTRGAAKILFVGPNNDFEVEDLGGSVFTYYLREALMGAAYRTRRRALTARGCVDYISAKLDSMTGRSMFLTTYSSTSDVVLSERVDYERVQPEISEVTIIDNGRAAPPAAPARGWLGMTTPDRGVGAAPLRAAQAPRPTIEVVFKVTAVHDVDRVLVNGVEAARSDEGPEMWCVELDVSDPAVRDAIERYQGVFIIATDAQSNTGINIQPFDAPTLPEQRHSYALLIGTDDYDAPEWTDLANPILDAKTVGARLEADYGFEVELLTNPTRGELRSKLAEYKKREYGPQDQLLIYVAGHGFYDEDLEIGHLVTRDAPAPERIGTDWSLTYSELTAIADRIDVHQKLLVLDVCFGGSAFIAAESSRSSVYDAPSRQAQIAHYMGFRAQNVLTAGGKVRVSDGVAGQHSPFARRLLAALATHGNKHGLLTFSSLYTRVEESNPTPVRGTFGSRHDPGGEFTLVARPDAR